MNDNKKFWQRYAPIYAIFMKNADKSYDEISKKVAGYLNKDMKVLELACGTGQLTFRLADKAKSWEATDFAENMIKEAKASYMKGNRKMDGLKFSVQDATNLSYEDASFDAVMIANALHIMPEPEKALAEIKRVLKKDGILYAPTFVHGESVRFKMRMKLIELFGFKAFLKPTIPEFVEFIQNMEFQVMGHDRIGSELAPLCCLIAKKSN